MGFILPCANRLTVIIGILIVVLREICIYTMEMLGLYREASCNGSSTTFGGSDVLTASDMDSFQYPYLTMNFHGNLVQANIRASLVPLMYKSVEECAKEVNARCGRMQGAVQDGSSMDCSVCLCEFERGQQVQITPNCCHVFHSECIHKWLDQDQKTCPLCRTSLLVHTQMPSMAAAAATSAVP